MRRYNYRYRDRNHTALLTFFIEAYAAEGDVNSAITLLQDRVADPAYFNSPDLVAQHAVLLCIRLVHMAGQVWAYLPPEDRLKCSRSAWSSYCPHSRDQIVLPAGSEATTEKTHDNSLSEIRPRSRSRSRSELESQFDSESHAHVDSSTVASASTATPDPSSTRQPNKKGILSFLPPKKGTTSLLPLQLPSVAEVAQDPFLFATIVRFLQSRRTWLAVTRHRRRLEKQEQKMRRLSGRVGAAASISHSKSRGSFSGPIAGVGHFSSLHSGGGQRATPTAQPSRGGNNAFTAGSGIRSSGFSLYPPAPGSGVKRLSVQPPFTEELVTRAVRAAKGGLVAAVARGLADRVDLHCLHAAYLEASDQRPKVVFSLLFP